MNEIVHEVLLGLIALVFLPVVYSIAFNGRYTSWRQGRRNWREMGRFRRWHA